MVGKYIPRFFPSTSGSLFIITASQHMFEEAASWGDGGSVGIHALTECWGLRNGRPYAVTDTDSKIVCQHVMDTSPGETLCVPMVAQGEALGVLHISHLERSTSGNDAAEHSFATLTNLCVTLADNIALALSNLKLRETLQDQALRDSLTGLFNQRHMEASFEREIDRAGRRKTTLAAMMIDLDHFKRFNDVNGHAAGDAVLRELGKFLQANTRAADIACRYGGEEFSLILPDTPPGDAVKRAEELREAFKQMNIQYRGQTLSSATLSIGLAVYPDHGGTVDDLLRAADTALYDAKAAGRDRVVVADAN